MTKKNSINKNKVEPGTEARIALRNSGYIDAGNINQYIDRDGFKGLFNVLKSSPENIIGEIKKSGIRASSSGNPLWISWERFRNMPGPDKYLVCDAYETSFGSSIINALFEGDPYSVIEGMFIGARALGAYQGFIFINTDSGLDINKIKNALKQTDDYLSAGKNPALDFDFNLQTSEVDHYIIFDEESAKVSSKINDIDSLSDFPFPTVNGINNKPTIVHTAETWANISAIFQMGAEYFAGFGTQKSKGAKIISLSGIIKNKGVFEVPFGISLNNIIEYFGGGIDDDNEIKAIQIGGHLGGYLPASELDTPMDYDDLISRDCILGTGSLMVLGKNTCIVDFTKNIISYTQSSSCRECVICREGTAQMLKIITDISSGKGGADDIDLLVELGNGLKLASLCSFGKNAANIMLTSIKYFEDEYKIHIKERKCPVNICKMNGQ